MVKKNDPYINNSGEHEADVEIWHRIFKGHPFRSTALYHAQYRPPYPKEAIALIADTFSLHRGIPSGKLVDLACGPGTLTVKLTPYFQQVAAVDIESEMLKLGKTNAENLDLTHINWIHGHAENVIGRMKNIRLISIGNALHWLQRAPLLKECYKALKPGGGLLIIDILSFKHPHIAPWQRDLLNLVYVWLDKIGKTLLAQRAYQRQAYDPPITRLQTLPFSSVVEKTIYQAHTYTLEGIIGYLHSRAFCSPDILGSHLAAFDNEVRTLLKSHSSKGEFTEQIPVAIIMAKK